MTRSLALAFALFLAPASSAQTPQTIASAYGGTIPAGCTGSRIDLNQLGHCECTQQRPRVKINGQWAMPTVILDREPHA